MAFRYDRLKALRKEKGYKQVTLAHDLHVSRSTLAMWEIGQSEPTTEMCSRIAELLDCSVGSLIGTEEEVNAIKAFDALRAKFLATAEEKITRPQTIDHQRTGQLPDINSIEYALSDAIRDLSEAGKQDVLEFALFRQAQEAKEKAKHDD